MEDRITYEDLGYDKLLTRKSIIDLSNGITNANVDAIIGGGAIGFGQTDLSTINNKMITLDISKGTGDAGIKAGKTSFSDDTNGFIIGLDDSDNDKVKFELGDASNYLKWTGSELNIKGEITATTGEIGGWAIGETALTATSIILDSGNEKITIGASNPMILDGTSGSIKTAETVGAGSNGVIMDTDGLRGYDSILGNVFNLPTDGSAPTFSSGIINKTIFNINTNAVLRTAETVGDGSANSAGVLIDNTGVYICEANQETASANFKALADGTVLVKGTMTITGGSGITNLDGGDLVTKNEAEIDQTALLNSAAAGADVTQTAIDGGLITTGYITLNTAGNIKSGKTNYADTDVGFWLGNDSGTPKFNIGNSTDYFKWDGSNVKMLCSSENAIHIQYGSDILLEHGGDIKFTSVTAPTACTATLIETDTGNVDAGEHKYKITYVNEAGETELGAVSNTVTTDSTHKQVDLTNISISTSDSVIARKIYRTKVGESNYYLLTTIADNTTITYIDDIADIDLIGESANEIKNNSFGKIIVDDNIVLSLDYWNSKVGYSALKNNTTGFRNTALGAYSLYENMGGYRNTAVGNATLYNNTTGASNTAVGQGTLYSNTIGYENTAIGREALASNTEGKRNTAAGETALARNISGDYNSAIGASALYYNTGDHNTANGAFSLYSNTTGYKNISIGYGTLYSNTTGSNNVANGTSSLFSNTEGNRNVAIGCFSLCGNTTGNYNVALGNYAGRYETGSNTFYVNNQDRINTAGDKEKSLMYGIMNTDQTLQKLQVNANLNIGAGNTRLTTAGTRLIQIFDGIAPVGILPYGISLYSTSGELRVMDAPGNATLLSPHDKKTNNWIYDCIDKNGKTLRIEMEQMMKAINKKFGWDFIKEFKT